MSGFGFDPGIILSGPAAPQQTLGDLLQQRLQRQQGQANLDETLYRQGRERTLADLVSQNAGSYTDPAAQTYARGGFADQAMAAQNYAAQQQATAAKLLELHADITRSRLATVKTQDQYDKFLSAMPQDVQAAYNLPPTYDPEAVKSFISSGISPEERQKLGFEQQKVDLQRTEMNKRRYMPDGTGGIYDTWTGTRTAQAPGQAGGASDSTPLPFAGLKPNQLEDKWKQLQSGISTTGLKGSGKLQAELQDRLFNADRLEALIKLPTGEIAPLTPQQVREGATALANLISTKGSAAMGQIDELVPHTMAGEWANIRQKILNEPQGADATSFLQNMLDTAGRERVVTKRELKDLQSQALPGLVGLRKLNKSRYDSMLTGAHLDPSEYDDNGLLVPKSAGGSGLQPGEVLMRSPDGRPHAVPQGQVDTALAHNWTKG